MLRRLKNTAIKTTAAGLITVGVIEVTTNLPSQGRSSEFYHKICDDVALPTIRTLLSPEDAHNFALECLKRNLAPRFRPSSLEQRYTIDTSCAPFHNRKDVVFSNCIGLAAGFDKDGVAVKELFDVGFGFVEIGSVTPLPQEGNPKPRMFRLSEDRGVINRFGFNSVGMDAVRQNIEEFRRRTTTTTTTNVTDDDDDSEKEEEKTHGVSNMLLSAMTYALATISKKLLTNDSPPMGLLGINIGKNKASDDEIADYQQGILKLAHLADYIVINISSPNTPGLRQLQTPDRLFNLLTKIIETIDTLPSSPPPPLLVKISPDLTSDELFQLAQTIQSFPKICGVIISNTTITRPSTLSSPHKNETGGLSGVPLREISTEKIRQFYQLTNGSIPIIGVGGVRSGRDVYEKLRAGASVVQLYSGLVFDGPGVVSKLRRELVEEMRMQGVRRVEDVIGADHEEIWLRKRMERLNDERKGESVIIDE